MSDVTQILNDMAQGDPHAAARLLHQLYDDLRHLAAQKLAHERPGQTLQPTALVHEAYLRLVGDGQGQSWENRRHFFAAAAEAMRRILVESARRKKRTKRGGALQRVNTAAEPAVQAPLPPDEILALDEALTNLAEQDADAARIVQLRFFAGLPLEEVADVVGLSRATVYRLWSFARVWLRSTMTVDGEDAPGRDDP